MRARTRIMPLLVLIGAIASGAFGQEIRVGARLSEDRTYVGEPVTLTVIVRGATGADIPDPPRVPSVDVSFQDARAGNQFLVQIENGNRRQVSVDYFQIDYLLIPREAGRHAIPPIEVVVDGDAHSTPALTLTAIRPRAGADSVLIAEAERSVAYVGQPVPLRLIWHTNVSTARTLSGILPVHRVDLHTPSAPPWRDEGVEGEVRMPFLGDQVTAGVRRNALHENRIYEWAVVIDLILVPTEPGELRIGPFELTYDIEPRRGLRRSPYEIPGRRERRSVRSEPVVIEVRPLPGAGRPETFNGLIGRAGIGLRARGSEPRAGDPLRAKVGDPIELELTIRADEPISRVIPPPLGDQGGGWDAYQLDPAGWIPLDDDRGVSRTWRTVVRARDDAIDALPPIELAYLDTETGRYAIASSDALPIEIEPTRVVTAADALGAGGALTPLSPPGETVPLESRHAGVLDNARGPALLRDENPEVLALFRSPGGLALLLAPPAIYVGVAGALLIRRRVSSASSRRGHALSRGLRALRGSGSARERVGGAIRVYLAERFDREARTITPKDCRELLGPERADDVPAALASMLHDAERGRFDASPPGREPPIEAAEELLRRAERPEEAS